MKKANDIDRLLASRNAHIRQLHRIVKEAMQEEELIIGRLNNPPAETLTRGQRISDKVARFGGSWAFIISFALIITAWIAFNSLVRAHADFDPYPFILLNLILSCLAALQAPIIMMSQNRQEEKDRQRAENDYMINLKAELELRSLHRKFDLLLEEQVRALFNAQAKQLRALEQIQAKLDAR
jgi:uncharacterized membrane protein